MARLSYQRTGAQVPGGLCCACLQGQNTKPMDPGAWATGIVEVALPMEYKMRNIEQTEAAKRELLSKARWVNV